jgi:gentisate 1,2-dioxygenase
VFKTITFLVQIAASGERSLPVRQTSNLLVAPFEGKGHSIVDGQRFDWRQFDTLAGPGRLLVRARQRIRQGPGLPVHRQRRADAEEA